MLQERGGGGESRRWRCMVGGAVGLYTPPMRVVVKVGPESLRVQNKLIIRSLILS